MIKTALFDMDGTMYDTERLSLEGWLKAASEMGIPLTADMIKEFRGSNLRTNAARFKGWFGPEAPYYETRKLRTDYVTTYIREHGVPVKAGLFPLLMTLREKNIKSCVATVTRREEAAPYWEKSGVLPFFDGTLCGDEVVNGKPDPEIFLKAAAMMKSDPSECIVFEDSPNGIRAAAAAGCHACMIPDLDRPTPEIAVRCEWIVDSLLDAAAIVDSFPAAE